MSPENKGKEHFYRGNGGTGRAVANKKSTGVNWAFEVQWFFTGGVDSLSLAGLLPGKEKNLSTSQ